MLTILVKMKQGPLTLLVGATNLTIRMMIGGGGGGGGVLLCKTMYVQK